MRRSPRTHPAPSWMGTDGWAMHSAPHKQGGSVTFSRTPSRSAPPGSCRIPCLPTQHCLPLFCSLSGFVSFPVFISPLLCAMASVPQPRVNVLPLTKAGALHSWSQPDQHQCLALAKP